MLMVLGGGTCPQPRPKRSDGGYTILELMIVLAVSVIILVSAAAAIGGSNAKTQFAQGMRDVNSKMQDWINDVADGFAGGTPSQYNCTLNSNSRPQINSGSGSTKPDCIYLGKAIQLTTQGITEVGYSGGGTIYTYSVFGRRTMDASGSLSDTIYNANPMPAVGSAAGAGNIDLTERYNIPNGTQIKSVTGVSSPQQGIWNMAGFYSNLNATGSTANGSQDVNAYLYQLGPNAAPGDAVNGSVDQCLTMTTLSCFAGSPSAGPAKLLSWKICFQSAYDNETAQITFTSASGIGVQTKLEFISC